MSLYLGDRITTCTVRPRDLRLNLGHLVQDFLRNGRSWSEVLADPPYQSSMPIVGWTYWAVHSSRRLMSDVGYERIWRTDRSLQRHPVHKGSIAWGIPEPERLTEACPGCDFDCYSYFTPPAIALGLVAGWGTVELHELGWRASRAWPLTVWLFCRTCAHDDGEFRRSELLLEMWGGGASGLHEPYFTSRCLDHFDEGIAGYSSHHPVLSAEVLASLRAAYGIPNLLG